VTLGEIKQRAGKEPLALEQQLAEYDWLRKTAVPFLLARIEELERAPRYVYEVQGWFGDQEWSEGLWMDKREAEKVCTRLQETRDSDFGPDYARGLHKFAVEEREVQGISA
jgi:hypothetical protein